MTIPFRIRQIKTQQFAMFPDLLVNGKDVSIQSEFNFGVNRKLSIRHNFYVINSIFLVHRFFLLVTYNLYIIFQKKEKYKVVIKFFLPYNKI